jgi:hypothetical protein
MTDAFKKEIHNFDNGRAISAWDGLVARQQQELERMRVPAMFHTTVAQDRGVSIVCYYACVSDPFIDLHNSASSRLSKY